MANLPTCRTVNPHRLFIAIWPDEAMRLRLLGLQQACHCGQKPVAAANLHLTLLFLGQVEDEHLVAVRSGLARVQGVGFHLVLNRWGRFRRAGILWVGPDQPPGALLDLHYQIQRTCRPWIDSVQKQQAYVPHVTLFRGFHDRTWGQSTGWSHEASLPDIEPAVTGSVKAFSLVESHSGVYRSLQVFPLR